MRHTGLSMALTVVLLTIAVVLFAIGRLLVFVIRFTALPPAGSLAATLTAIAVATITAATDVEDRPTVISTTESLAKDNVVPSPVPPHPHPIAGWTSGRHHETLMTLRVVDCLSVDRYEFRPQPFARLGSFIFITETYEPILQKLLPSR